MTITISIKEPVSQETELIGLKDDLAYVLELNNLTVERIDIQEGKR